MDSIKWKNRETRLVAERIFDHEKKSGAFQLASREADKSEDGTAPIHLSEWGNKALNLLGDNRENVRAAVPEFSAFLRYETQQADPEMFVVLGIDPDEVDYNEIAREFMLYLMQQTLSLLQEDADGPPNAGFDTESAMFLDLGEFYPDESDPHTPVFEVLKRMPSDAREWAINNVMFFTPCGVRGCSPIVPNLLARSAGVRFVPDKMNDDQPAFCLRMVYLAPQMLKERFELQVAVVAHELAHHWLRHPARTQVSGVCDEPTVESEADDQACAWRFDDEIRALREHDAAK